MVPAVGVHVAEYGRAESNVAGRRLRAVRLYVYSISTHSVDISVTD